jgi:hypothetical protein
VTDVATRRLDEKCSHRGRWSEFSVIFDHHGQPDVIVHSGTYHLVVESIVASVPHQGVDVWGSGLNIMYIETFDGLGIVRSALCPSSVSFHGIIVGSLFSNAMSQEQGSTKY